MPLSLRDTYQCIDVFQQSLLQLQHDRSLLEFNFTLSKDAFEAAKRSYVDITPGEIPLCFVNQTTFVSPKGLLLTNRRLFYKADEIGQFEVDHIHTVILRETKLLVNGQVVADLRWDPLFCRSQLVVFLTHALVLRRVAVTMDLIRDFLERLSLDVAHAEVLLDSPIPWATTTSGHLLSLHSEWALPYDDVVEVLVGRPVTHYRPGNPNHPLISLGVALFKFAKEKLDDSNHHLLIHSRSGRYLTFKRNAVDEVMLTERDANEQRDALTQFISRYRQSSLK